ncbi:MAG: hypothetical protein LBB53_02965 [Prevotellaceae bacterium]|jgi:hypothetical protein|nr:hypothetical protein [Prevotellaceae bacterium]
MITINIVGKPEPAKVPSSWDELTNTQAQSVFREYFLFLLHKNYERFLDNLLCYFMPMCKKRGFSFSFGKDKKKVTNAIDIAHIIFDWLIKFDGEKLTFHFPEIKNRIPEIKIGKFTFKGPDDLLFDITYEEFECANNAQAAFWDGDQEAINRFVASLYRVKRNGKRENIENKNIDDVISANLKFIRKIPEWQKIMISYWYSNCILYIRTGDILVNGSTVNFSKLFTGGGSSKKNPLGWQSNIFDLAKNGIFGTVENTRKARFFDILLVMLDAVNKNEEEKKELEKIKKRNKIKK